MATGVHCYVFSVEGGRCTLVIMTVLSWKMGKIKGDTHLPHYKVEGDVIKTLSVLLKYNY